MYDIIVFAHLFKPHLGGLEKYTETLYTNIPNKKILIITSKYKKDLKTEDKLGNLDILRTESIQIINDKYYVPSFTGLKQIKKVFKYNLQNTPEIHTHTRFYLSNLIAAFFAKKKHLVHFHFEHGASFVRDGSVLTRLFAKIYDYTFSRYTLKSSTLIFPISDSVKEFLTKHYRNLSFGPAIYNSLDFKNRDFKSKFKPEIPKLLFVGRLVKSKGIYELLGACNLMKERRIPFTLTIVGDGSERKMVREYIQEKELEKNVLTRGALPFEEVQKEYLKHDIFINPSHTEGFGLTVLEALSNGLIIIATDAGGTQEIINKENLIPLEKLSPEILTEEILKTLDQWEEKTLLHKDLFEQAKKKFSIDNVIKRYLEASDNI